MLVVTGNRNRDDLVKTLETDGRAIVDIFPVYRTELNDLTQDPAAQAFREGGADALAFTSASTVESFVKQAKQLQVAPGGRRPLACAIGPLTAAALRAQGLTVEVEAPEHSLDGLVAAVRARLTAER
jgi:uroporphyrinogen-III synthase